MPINAQLADGRVLEFPDGTDPGVIQGTVKKLMAQQQAMPQGPEEGMGQAALIAAGRGTDKIVQGVKQAYYGLKSKFEDPTLSSLIVGKPSERILSQMAADEAEKDALYAPLRAKHPFTTGMAETAPALALAPFTGGSTVGAAAVSAIPSLVSYGTPQERLTRGAIDGAFGAAGNLAGKAITRVLKPAGAGTQGASNAALDAAERVGYKPLPSQIANNPGMAGFENYLLRNPGSSGTMQKVATANQEALNRAGARAMGETGSTLDEGVFGAAKSRLGNEFERLSGVTKPQLGDDFINALARIEADNTARGPFANKQISSLLDKGLDLAAKGNLEGKAYKEIRTELSSQAQAAFKSGDATAGQAYKTVVNALDDAAKASLSEVDKKAWDVARKEWGAFRTLTKSNVAEAGNLSAPRVAAAVRGQGPALRTGQLQGELADVARLGEAFKGVANPTSGQLTQNMLYGNPFTGVPLFLGNKAAAAAYMSPLGQRYFSRGLLDVGETGQGLLTRAGVQGAIPVGRNLLGVE